MTRPTHAPEEARRPPPPPRYVQAIMDAMPDPKGKVIYVRRTAGAGSLGRPRFVGTMEWHGFPILREAKAALPSAWTRVRKRANVCCFRGTRGCRERARGMRLRSPRLILFWRLRKRGRRFRRLLDRLLRSSLFPRDSFQQLPRPALLVRPADRLLCHADSVSQVGCTYHQFHPAHGSRPAVVSSACRVVAS